MKFNLNQQRKLYKQKNEFLDQHEACTRVTPEEFYRDLFPAGSFQEKGVLDDGRGNGIVLEVNGDGTVQRYTVTDDLKILKRLTKSDFAVMAPVSYFGKRRTSENSRYLYAMTFDLDGVGMPQIRDVLYQCSTGFIPTPTYLVNSGTGLHLYYFFETPVPMYPDNRKYLKEIKFSLTDLVWNAYTSTIKKQQKQGIFQTFRIVGGATKLGKARSYPVVAYRIGNGQRYDTDTLLNCVLDPKDRRRVRSLVEKDPNTMTLAQAKQAYPDWYERRIVKGEPRGTWQANRALYDWWKQEMHRKITVGHRYFGIMSLAIFAKKCGIAKEELKRDAYSYLEEYDILTKEESNHFTRQDIRAALKAYNNDYITFPREEIARLTGVRIDANRRNGRTQSVHVQYMNHQRAFKVAIGECTNGGRPDKKDQVVAWRIQNPDGKKIDCERETGMSRPTVLKWWDSAEAEYERRIRV